MNEAVYIPVEGPSETKHGRPTLEEAQKYVGGWVEMVEGVDDQGPYQVIVNEEGLILGLRQNIVATLVANLPLVGPAILLRGDCMWD